MAELSHAALQQLREQMDAAIAQPQPVPHVAAAIGPQDFCKIWPTAKPVLEVLVGIVVLIPGLGAGAAAALRALIVVGDQVFKATCKT
jgi:hypothetical protein